MMLAGALMGVSMLVLIVGPRYGIAGWVPDEDELSGLVGVSCLVTAPSASPT